MSNKKADSLTLEELQLAYSQTENNETVDINVEDALVSDFLAKFNIVAGPNPVFVKLLYRIFNKLNPNTLSSFHFTTQLQTVLDVNVNQVVHINAESIYLHKEILKIKPKSKKNKLSSESHQRHFTAFMKTMGIGRGVHKLPPVILYHIYRTYCIDHKKKQMSLPIFSKFTEYFLDKKRGAECNYYLVNEVTKNIYPQEEFDGIKKIYRKEKVKKKSV